jgi:hypothetical protein
MKQLLGLRLVVSSPATATIRGPNFYEELIKQYPAPTPLRMDNAMALSSLPMHYRGGAQAVDQVLNTSCRVFLGRIHSWSHMSSARLTPAPRIGLCSICFALAT